MGTIRQIGHLSKQGGKMIKGRSIFSLMLSLTIVGFGAFTKPQLAAKANPSLIDNSVTANSDVINKPQIVAQKSQSGLITWREFIERGGRRFVDRDYDLPSEFRNGYLYINGGNYHVAYILKQGLPSYPPIKSEITQIDYDLGDSYVKSGKAIRFFWGSGTVGERNRKVRVEKPGEECLEFTCLQAPFMTKQQINRILRSERRIPQKK
ncbi:MAG: hypothetical protein ACBR11_09935 [Microcoleus sp.]